MGIGSITSDRRGVAPTLRQAGSSRLSRFPCVQVHHAISKRRAASADIPRAGRALFRRSEDGGKEAAG